MESKLAKCGVSRRLTELNGQEKTKQQQVCQCLETNARFFSLSLSLSPSFEIEQNE